MEYETKLRIYERLLAKWNPAINLVAPATLPDAQSRHFDDSAQLVELLPSSAAPDFLGAGEAPRPRPTLVDFGSGAGFPGMVLAILRPDLDVHLVESDERKCAFLKTVSRETFAPITLHNCRIESLAAFAADILTARALAPLDSLLPLAAPWFALNPRLSALFLKGRSAAAEIAATNQHWAFELETIPSRTAQDGCILRITNLKSCA